MDVQLEVRLQRQALGLLVVEDEAEGRGRGAVDGRGSGDGNAEVGVDPAGGDLVEAEVEVARELLGLDLEERVTLVDERLDLQLFADLDAAASGDDVLVSRAYQLALEEAAAGLELRSELDVSFRAELFLEPLLDALAFQVVESEVHARALRSLAGGGRHGGGSG
jgi:hypothetical protein